MVPRNGRQGEGWFRQFQPVSAGQEMIALGGGQGYRHSHDPYLKYGMGMAKIEY